MVLLDCPTVDGRILHHLGWFKPYEEWDKPPINGWRISSIHSKSFLHIFASIARFKIRQFQNGSLEFGLDGWYIFFLAKDTKRTGWHWVVIASHPNCWPAHQSWDQRWSSPWFMNPQSAFDSWVYVHLNILASCYLRCARVSPTFAEIYLHSEPFFQVIDHFVV